MVRRGLVMVFVCAGAPTRIFAIWNSTEKTPIQSVSVPYRCRL